MADRNGSGGAGPDRRLLDEYVELYALDALDAQETAAFESQLDLVPESEQQRRRAQIADIRETLAQMSSQVQTAPPNGLRLRVLAAADASGQGYGGRPDGGHTGGGFTGATTGPAAGAEVTDLAAARARSTRMRRWAIAGIAVAAAVIVAIGGGVVGRVTSPDRGSTTTTTVAEPAPGGGSSTGQTSGAAEQISAILAEPDAQVNRTTIGGSTAAVTVASSKSLNQALVVITSAPQPPAEHAYQLWVMGADHKPRSEGTMVHMDPTVTAKLKDLSGFDEVAITVEPRDGSPAPTTSPIVSVAL
ncbi:hypothetical protein GCM10027169_30620 [Gordonia jinhuaensis]|uniref:Regulator of SigK n=1 Tax=Gordonia jinhuaensis TaxID=1517702 RepID=A0A916T7Z8_9ACTN|nr:anti-sigma factor [Gordonia jinhuaensis]GGB35328.1 hypothetical protein GCM10011489_24210 [Gordonia jinhuaensis]